MCSTMRSAAALLATLGWCAASSCSASSLGGARSLACSSFRSPSVGRSATRRASSTPPDGTKQQQKRIPAPVYALRGGALPVYTRSARSGKIVDYNPARLNAFGFLRAWAPSVFNSRCGVVWWGGVWCGVVWCGVVWGVVWCVYECGNNNHNQRYHRHTRGPGAVWCGVVGCGVVWCRVACL